MIQVPMTEIRATHRKQQHPLDWFAEDAMAFFRTELPQYGFKTPAGLAFVTAETSPSGERRFTVRLMVGSGRIETIGGFHAHATRGAAMAVIKQLAKEHA